QRSAPGCSIPGGSRSPGACRLHGSAQSAAECGRAARGADNSSPAGAGPDKQAGSVHPAPPDCPGSSPSRAWLHRATQHGYRNTARGNASRFLNRMIARAENLRITMQATQKTAFHGKDDNMTKSEVKKFRRVLESNVIELDGSTRRRDVIL